MLMFLKQKCQSRKNDSVVLRHASDSDLILVKMLLQDCGWVLHKQMPHLSELQQWKYGREKVPAM